MTATTRLGMELVDGTDTIGGVNPSLQAKFNAALNKIDKTAGLVICTSTTRPTTDLYPGIVAYETDTKRRIRNTTGVVGDWQPLADDAAPSLGRGGIRPIRQFSYYTGGTGHSAFPSVVVRRDGVLVMVWRQGTDHVDSRDGVIKKATSSDGGRTWSAATTAINSVVGTDLRDPCISISRDGLALYMTYFKGTTSLAAAGVYFSKSTDGGTTWSTEVRVEAQPYSASSGPCVELDNGTLVVPWYGRAGAETLDSVWTSKSTNGGTSWVETRILNGQTLGVNLQEPWISMNGQNGVMAYRYNTNASIGVSTTSDNTANWSGAVAKFAGSGRPTIWYANGDTIACVYRQIPTDSAAMRISRDNGANWYQEKWLEKKWSPNTSLGMTYAGVDKLSNGSTILVMGQENTSTSSRIVWTFLGEAGADTPFGAIPTEELALATDADTLVYGTNFDQPDGAFTYPWFTGAGGLTVINGELTSSAADNVADFAVVFSDGTDMYIEADIKHVGTQSGAGILFRYVSSTTYMLFTLETGHTTWRLYKFISGVATQIATNVVHSEALPTGVYLRFWVEARGTLIRAGAGKHEYFNFQHTASEAGGNSYSTFSTNGKWGGVKLNAQATGSSQNYCRRFMMWR